MRNNFGNNLETIVARKQLKKMTMGTLRTVAKLKHTGKIKSVKQFRNMTN